MGNTAGCRCLIDRQRSMRSAPLRLPPCGHREVTRSRARRLRLGLTGALALPALALAVTAGSTPSRSAASTATASIVPVSQVTMSDCALSVTQCEVEVADLSDPTSIRLTDGALSVAPTRVISIALRSEGQPRVRHVEKPLSLHAYFKLPKAKRARWRLMVESRHHQRRSFALPTPRPPTSTL